MAAVFTLGSLLGLLLLVVIGAVITLGIIVCLCVCHRKQKNTGKSIIYTLYIYKTGIIQECTLIGRSVGCMNAHATFQLALGACISSEPCNIISLCTTHYRSSACMNTILVS